MRRRIQEISARATSLRAEDGQALQNADTNIANVAVREAAVIGSTASETCAGQSYNTLIAWTECESTVMGGPALTSVCAR